MTEKIIRKDGIVYERKKRNTEDSLDSNLCIRIDSKLIEKLKQIAKEENIKYNQLVREVLEDYAEMRLK